MIWLWCINFEFIISITRHLSWLSGFSYVFLCKCNCRWCHTFWCLMEKIPLDNIDLRWENWLELIHCHIASVSTHLILNELNEISYKSLIYFNLLLLILLRLLVFFSLSWETRLLMSQRFIIMIRCARDADKQNRTEKKLTQLSSAQLSIDHQYFGSSLIGISFYSHFDRII